MKAIGRTLGITSKKLNLIADLVRKQDATMATNILKFTPKKGAKILYKLVRSAIANAENNLKQEAATLYIKEIIVTEGPTLKRSLPVSRGRSHPILKRKAHATVILGVKEQPETEAPDKKSATAKTTQAATPQEKPVAPAKKEKKTMGAEEKTSAEKEAKSPKSATESKKEVKRIKA